MEITKNTHNQSKLSKFLIGDIEVWKKLPIAFKQLREDLKDKKKVLYLIVYSLLGFLIMFSIMSATYYLQNRTQYCEVSLKEIPQGSIYTGVLIDKVPLNNKSLDYYLRLYRNRLPANLLIRCKWDIKRYIEDLNNGK